MTGNDAAKICRKCSIGKFSFRCGFGSKDVDGGSRCSGGDSVGVLGS